MKTTLAYILLLYSVLCFQGRTPLEVTFYDNSVVSYEPASRIEIEMQEVSKEETADDGTVCFVLSYSYPIVSISGNNSAAEKINANIRAGIDEFLTYVDNFGSVDWAKKQYADGELYEPYDETLTFHKIQRADDNIISFTVNHSYFTGGVHPGFEVYGVNYDCKTGTLLSLSDLGEDSASFCANLNAYNQEASKAVSYKNMLLEEDNTDQWFLSSSGLTCLKGSWSVMEWTIPYCILFDMGFSDEYAYYDRPMLCLEEDQIYSIDLNGDHNKDYVLFYDEYVEWEDRSQDYMAHLILNGVDFAEQYSAQYLCDLDRTDSYVELMRISAEYEEEEYVFYSNFYRYMEDGTLTYLGRIKGDARDPMVDISEFTASLQ